MSCRLSESKSEARAEPCSSNGEGEKSTLAPFETLAPLETLARRVRRQIPITRHLDFSLFADAADNLVATAPLAPNANHRRTAFGGSLSMLATVAGWAMTTLLLQEEGYETAEVVIQRSRMDFEAPVCGRLTLRCRRPSEESCASFFETLRRWGRARLSLRCTAKEGAEETAFSFKGAYVALTSQ